MVPRRISAVRDASLNMEDVDSQRKELTSNDTRGCDLNKMMCRRPSGTVNTDATTYERRIGYYELFSLQSRTCDVMLPEQLAVAPLTHINLAFVLFDSNFNLIDNAGDIISRVTFLKARYAGLRVNIAIGGVCFFRLHQLQSEKNE